MTKCFSAFIFGVFLFFSGPSAKATDDLGTGKSDILIAKSTTKEKMAKKAAKKAEKAEAKAAKKAEKQAEPVKKPAEKVKEKAKEVEEDEEGMMDEFDGDDM